VPVQQPGDLASCAVCGRTILPGERIAEYVSVDGERVGVCTLCKPRAEASGWIPAEHAGRLAREPTQRRRRSLNWRQAIKGASDAAARLGRREQAEDQEAAPVEADAGKRPQRPPRPERSDRQARPERGQRSARQQPTAPAKHRPSEPLTRERLLHLAVEAFNAGQGPRKIAGLTKSLGEPHVAVRPDGAAKALVTVAWELSWYQWNVELDGAAEVREVRKGRELSELEADEQTWNASVGDDGRLRLELAAAGSAGGQDS